MKKIKFNKVTEETIKNLTENFINLSTDGAVFISKDSKGSEVFVGVQEYESTIFVEPLTKVEKINEFIYEGIIYNIVNKTYLGYIAVNDCGDYYEVLAIEDTEQNYSLFNAIKGAMNFPATTQQYKNYYVSMENIDDDGIDVVRVNSDKTFTHIEVSPYQLTEDYIEKN